VPHRVRELVDAKRILLSKVVSMSGYDQVKRIFEARGGIAPTSDMLGEGVHSRRP